MDETTSSIHILAFCGSLRADSFNQAVLNYAMEHSPENVRITQAQFSQLPLFNQDLEQQMPSEVQQLKQDVTDADAILFVTPEYNYSVPGGLKNAIDWISRPYGQNSFAQKPVGIMTASIGMIGGARAQYHLRQMCVFLDMYPLNQPEVMVSFAADKIKNGQVIDPHTQEKITELLEALRKWTQKLQS